MRIGLVPEGPVERVVAWLGLAPRPLLETQVAYTLARVVMVATKLGMFEALAEGPRTPGQVADSCGSDPAATAKLMFALAGSGYLEQRGGAYELAPVTRKWLLEDSSASLVDKLLFQFREWSLMEHAEDFVRTGKPLELHQALDDRGWREYQRGMRSLVGAFAGEAARRIPIPRGAKRMLDIGGSHGYYSVALCRRHDGLASVVLELPEAIAEAAPLLEAEGMGDRVVHRAGDATRDDLGEREYDLVVMAQVAHHFSDEQNRDLARRVARALRPGGVYAILDSFRSDSADDAGQIPALLDFYFSLTSASGTWTPGEMAAWQRAAGLDPRRPIRLRTAPGGGIQAAVRPG